jgi:hypothetical protein
VEDFVRLLADEPPLNAISVIDSQFEEHEPGEVRISVGIATGELQPRTMSLKLVPTNSDPSIPGNSGSSIRERR